MPQPGPAAALGTAPINVKSLPLGALRLLVLAVASWAAFLLLRSARRGNMEKP